MCAAGFQTQIFARGYFSFICFYSMITIIFSTCCTHCAIISDSFLSLFPSLSPSLSLSISPSSFSESHLTLHILTKNFKATFENALYRFNLLFFCFYMSLMKCIHSGYISRTNLSVNFLKDYPIVSNPISHFF